MTLRRRTAWSVCCLLAALAALAAWQVTVDREPGGPGRAKAEEPPAQADNAADNTAGKAAARADKDAALEKDVTQGALRVVGAEGGLVECPLEHTDVRVDISGFLARVNVTQTFHNPTDEKIEAVYVFPLPHEAAVDNMTMLVGERKIVGLIKRRADARQIYEQALVAGQTAALLEQERPNIFTQSVGNIEPGQKVRIEISYVDVLDYDQGEYEFRFPMVVGPRYNPGAPTGTPEPRPPELAGKVSPPESDTTRVPDASRISPPVLKPEYRNGHDISLAVSLDAGVPVHELEAANHEAAVETLGASRATVKLSDADSLPNKDFVLRYRVVGPKPAMAVLAHRAGGSADARKMGGGYFMLMIQPREDERLAKSPPRELVFLVDVSGSMSGEPTAKVVEAMQHMLKLCRPQDTVQVITFANQAQKLFHKPVPVNGQNIQRALQFTSGLEGRGGTEMLKGVKLAMDEPIDAERVRIVVMLTDGYIGNEAEIIEHVGRRGGDQVRFWCIGIGSSPNMFLVDGVARQGGGMGKQLGLTDDAAVLSQEVITRIQRAQLAKIRIDWGGLAVAETYPARVPDLWAGGPVVLLGRYAGGGQAVVSVSGTVEGEPVRWPLEVALPADEPAHDVLAKTWARRKIEDLMQQTFYHGSPAVEEEVTAIALDYRLMSQYTSFVAVDEREAGKLAEPAGPPRRMLVPVPLPAGTRWEGFFRPSGESDGDEDLALARPRQVEGKSEALYARRSLTARMRGYSAGGRMRGGAFGATALTRSGAIPGDRAAVINNATVPGLRVRLLDDSDSMRLNLDRSPIATSEQPTWSFLASQAEALREQAEAAAKSGGELQKKGRLEAARAAFSRSWLLGAAAAQRGAGEGEQAHSAEAALEEIHAAQLRRWIKELPALDQKLDLVIRDQSVPEALAAVAEAAGIDIQLRPGSVEDAAALMDQTDVRISFVDLRGATVAQALDWILRPSRMRWWAAEGAIVAGTDRRGSGQSAWVYDVRTIALPSDKELAPTAGDFAKATQEAGKAAETFLSTVRRRLEADEEAVTWFAPGQLLVIGDKKVHASAAGFLADLANPKARMDGESAGLHRVATRRAAELGPRIAQARAEVRQAEVAAAHEEYGWQLLAAAAAGQLDLEALTQFQIAWRSGETAELLKGESPLMALRSLWCASEAARTLPREAELSALAESARTQARQAAADALARLEKGPSSPTAFLSALYAALAFRGDERFVERALPLLVASESPAGGRTVAQALAGESAPGPAELDSLVQAMSSETAGQDMVVLAALACRRAGGEAWESFRGEGRAILGRQPLPGGVVVLVNRLAAQDVPLAAVE